MSENIECWSVGGPNRFYFTEAYNPKEKIFDEPPYDIININKFGKGRGKGKCTIKKIERAEKKEVIETPVDYPTMPRKLRMLDIFAGCGGTLYSFSFLSLPFILFLISYTYFTIINRII